LARVLEPAAPWQLAPAHALATALSQWVTASVPALIVFALAVLAFLVFMLVAINFPKCKVVLQH